LNTEVVSNLLVNQEQKQEYDELIKERNSLQSKLETELQRASGVRKADIASTVSNDMEANQDFVAAIQAALEMDVSDDYSGFKYRSEERRVGKECRSRSERGPQKEITERQGAQTKT